MKKKQETPEIISYNPDAPSLVDVDDALLEAVTGGCCNKNCPALVSCGVYEVCCVDLEV